MFVPLSLSIYQEFLFQASSSGKNFTLLLNALQNQAEKVLSYDQSSRIGKINEVPVLTGFFFFFFFSSPITLWWKYRSRVILVLLRLANAVMDSVKDTEIVGEQHGQEVCKWANKQSLSVVLLFSHLLVEAWHWDDQGQTGFFFVFMHKSLSCRGEFI